MRLYFKHNRPLEIFISIQLLSLLWLKPSNSTYPINEQSTYKRHDEFVKRIENDFPHPFKKLIRWSNGIAAGADIQIFVTNYINENDLHIQNSLIVAIVCLLSFLSTYCSHSKK